MPTLLYIRAEKNLSQREAARIAAISVGAYCKAETGKRIDRKTADQICSAFKIDLSLVEGLDIAPRRIKRPKSVV